MSHSGRVSRANPASNDFVVPLEVVAKGFSDQDLVGGDSLRLTLNVDNVANSMPPVANQSGGLFNNGTSFAESTTGRYVSFGVAKKF